MTNPSDSPTATTPDVMANRLRNLLVVLAAVILSVSLFLGLRTETGSTSLSAMAEESVPLEVALSNGKPTLMEFYANWCTTCQAMAGDVEALKQQYGDRVNFVMLNVDNTKWLPEILHYRVDGIPHFVYLQSNGEALAEAIGEQPKSVMEANLVALAAGETLPYTQASGKTSAFAAPTTSAKASSADPRSHGSQVVN